MILNAEVAYNGGNLLYGWTTPDGTIIQGGPTLVADLPGGYSVLVIDTVNGCQGENFIIVDGDQSQPLHRVRQGLQTGQGSLCVRQDDS